MSDWWTQLSASARALLDAHGLAVIALLLFFEELGIPSPIPGDFIMLVAGLRVAQGREALWVVLLYEELASVAGACFLYLFSRRFGRALVTRYGKYIHLGPATLHLAEDRVRRYGAWAVIVARLIPGLRIITVVAAGVLDQPFRTFFPAVSIGAFLYLLIYTILGMVAGPKILTLMDEVGIPVSALLSLGILVLMSTVMRSLEGASIARRPPVRAFLSTILLASIVAATMGLLAGNAVLGLVTFLGELLGHQVSLATVRESTSLRLLFGWQLFLVLALIASVCFKFLRLQRMPPLVQYVIIAGLPVVFTLIIANPLLENSTIVLSDSSRLLLKTVTVVRWLVFGLAFGRLIPLLARLRRPRGDVRTLPQVKQ